MINTEILDEFFGNTIDNDYSNLIGNDPNEEREDEWQHLLSYDRETNTERGTSQRTFSTTSLRHFNTFYHYLLANDYEAMVIDGDSHHFKVEVYGLSREQAILLEKVFIGNRRLRAVNTSGLAA